MRALQAVGVCVLLLSVGAIQAEEVPGRQWAQALGLAPANGVHLVIGHCTACHSAALITANRGDQAYWRKTIRWMQDTQRLWEIPAPDEEVILSYLATHYAEQEWGRRPPLRRELMP